MANTSVARNPGLFGSQLRDRTLVALALSGDGIHVRELARRLGTSPSAAFKTVESLERTGSVVSRMMGQSRMVSLNRRWFAALELRTLLQRLSAQYPDVIEEIETIRRRPRRIGKAI